jgi:hypothetical protein
MEQEGVMPRWRSLCKPGEEPSRLIQGVEFESLFGFRCGWSAIPEEWAPAVLRLVERIRAKYRVQGLDGDDDWEVCVTQVKDKFGSLRFYYSAQNREAMDEIDGWIYECEEELMKADPHYGVPY